MRTSDIQEDSKAAKRKLAKPIIVLFTAWISAQPDMP
jgi:hypothetical protein